MNKTVADARRNCDRGRTGSLAPGYTAEYLNELRTRVSLWLEEIVTAQIDLEKRTMAQEHDPDEEFHDCGERVTSSNPRAKHTDCYYCRLRGNRAD